MAVVRCEIHGIPYNDANPRGCPACAQEKEGAEATVAQELARASRAIRTGEPLTIPEEKKETGPPSAAQTREETLRELFRGTAESLHEIPREAATTRGRIDAILDRVGENKLLKFGLPAIALLAAATILTARPEFVDQVNPTVVDNPLPLPVRPGAPVEVLFAILGTQPPNLNPQAQQLAQYRYGTDLTVDALNNSVYAITYSVSNRMWDGISVGLDEEQVTGALSMLSTPVETTPGRIRPPQQHGRFMLYRTLGDRPVRRLQAEIRPPNGCYDLIVDLQYRALGVLHDGSSRSIVVGMGGQPPEWVSTRVRVVDRSVSGPYSGPAAC